MTVELSQREAAALDACARLIHTRRLTTPALLLLGAAKPVQRLTGAWLQLAMPYLEGLLAGETLRAFQDLLARPDGAELVCDLLTQRLDVLDRA